MAGWFGGKSARPIRTRSRHRFRPDARWNPERFVVEFGIGVGEYEGVVRVSRRVFQILLPSRRKCLQGVPLGLFRTSTINAMQQNVHSPHLRPLAIPLSRAHLDHDGKGDAQTDFDRIPTVFEIDLVFPKTIKPRRIHFGVPLGVLHLLVPQIGRQRQRIEAEIDESKTTPMAQQMPMNIGHPCLHASRAHHLVKRLPGHRRALVAEERESRSHRLGPPQSSQSADLAPRQWVNAAFGVLQPLNLDPAGVEIDLAPAQAHEARTRASRGGIRSGSSLYRAASQRL